MTGGNWNGKDIGSGITGGSVSNTGARRVLGVNEVGDQRDAGRAGSD